MSCSVTRSHVVWYSDSILPKSLALLTSFLRSRECSAATALTVSRCRACSATDLLPLGLWSFLFMASCSALCACMACTIAFEGRSSRTETPFRSRTIADRGLLIRVSEGAWYRNLVGRLFSVNITAGGWTRLLSPSRLPIQLSSMCCSRTSASVAEPPRRPESSVCCPQATEIRVDISSMDTAGLFVRRADSGLDGAVADWLSSSQSGSSMSKKDELSAFARLGTNASAAVHISRRCPR